MSTHLFVIPRFVVGAIALCFTGLLFAAENNPPPSSGSGAAGPAANDPAEQLAQEQKRVAEKYKHLEDVLLRMAELSAATDPRRAALLKKAVAQSKEELISVRLERLVELLGQEQLAKALENQTELDQDLRALLELLLSENRAKSIESEKARLREYLKRLSGLIKQEKDLQARTAGGDEMKQLAEEQAKVAEKTGQLAQDIKKNEEQKGGGKGKQAAQSGNPSSGGKPSSDSKQSPGGKQDGQPSPGGEQGSQSGGKQGSKSQGQPGGQQDGQSDGQQGEQSPDEQDAQQNPARKRLEAARARMQQAEKKLAEAKRQGAIEEQEEAIRELERAKAEIEEILRQLREEQIARLLAMLEARFRAMLQMQQEVYEGTCRLDRVPQEQRTHNHEIESGRLSNKESQIVVEVDKALLLLREDGSAVAFPEAIEQMREDMVQVVQRLAQAKVDKITQAIEEDIIAALKEMIEALKKAQKDLKNQRPPHGRPLGGQPVDPPLIDMLAELRMIRALQMRVNNRTERYSKMIEGEQAQTPELINALQRLAERQQRIHRVTRDLQLGKNQ